jgi:hypothetical protein
MPPLRGIIIFKIQPPFDQFTFVWPNKFTNIEGRNCVSFISDPHFAAPRTLPPGEFRTPYLSSPRYVRAYKRRSPYWTLSVDHFARYEAICHSVLLVGLSYLAYPQMKTLSAQIAVSVTQVLSTPVT